MWEAFQKEETPQKADWYTRLTSSDQTNRLQVELVFEPPSTLENPNEANPVLELSSPLTPSTTKQREKRKPAGKGRSGRKKTTPKKKPVDNGVKAMMEEGLSQLDELATATLTIVDGHKSPCQTVRKHQYAIRSRVVSDRQSSSSSSSSSRSKNDSINDSINGINGSPYYTRHEVTNGSKVEGNANAFDVRVPIDVTLETLVSLTQSRIKHDVVRLLDESDLDPGPAASVFLCAAPKDEADASMPLWTPMTKSVGGALTFDFCLTGERTLMMVDPGSERRCTRSLSLSLSLSPPLPHTHTHHTTTT
jgi:hypothetical protein